MKKLHRNPKPKAPVETKDGKAELMPAPTVPKKFHVELTQWDTRADKAVGVIRKKSEDILYYVVELGLYLMKIRQIHRLSDEEKSRLGVEARQNKQPVATVANVVSAEGFTGYLATKEDRFSERSAYNYINAALNCDLTENSTPAAVNKLRKAKTLAGKTLEDLYQSPKQISNGKRSNHNNPPPAPSIIKDALAENATICQNLVQLRSEMSDEEYETATDRLKETLEKLTDAKWDIVGDKGKS